MSPQRPRNSHITSNTPISNDPSVPSRSQSGPSPWPTGRPSLPTAAVLGSPIVHSLSPVLHRRAYQLMGQPFSGYHYTAFEVAGGQLAAFFERTVRLGDVDDATWGHKQGRWLGLSLTMPLKVEALDLVDHISPMAALVHCANTLVVHHSASEPVLCAHNTDVWGMVRALKQAGVSTVCRPAVLGGGATACSALAALAQLGARQVDLFLRNPTRSQSCQQVAERLGMNLRVHPWGLPALTYGQGRTAADGLCDVVMVTTPGGTTDALVDHPINQCIGGQGQRRHLPVLFDVAYDPWPTPLAAWWHQQAGTVINGLDLLVEQAIDQVALMTAPENNQFTVDTLPSPADSPLPANHPPTMAHLRVTRRHLAAQMRNAGLEALKRRSGEGGYLPPKGC